MMKPNAARLRRRFGLAVLLALLLTPGLSACNRQHIGATLPSDVPAQHTTVTGAVETRSVPTATIGAASTATATWSLPTPGPGGRMPVAPPPTLPPARQSDWTYAWLERQPCAAPCWEHIRPGTTTLTETIAILEQNPLTANVSRAELAIGIISWDWAHAAGGGAALAEETDPAGTVRSIAVIYPTSFQLQEVMRAYGEPSHIIATKSIGGHPGDPPAYQIIIVYVQHGFYMYADLPRAGQPELSPELLLVAPRFFQAGIDPGHLEDLWFLIPNALVPWEGMRDFDYYCRLMPGNQRACDE